MATGYVIADVEAKDKEKQLYRMVRWSAGDFSTYKLVFTLDKNLILTKIVI